MTILLSPLSLLFYIIVSLRNWLYDIGLLKSLSVEKPVLCVGNLTTGGTGKTPWVQFLCRYYEAQKKKVAIVSRGYGGDYEGLLEVKSDMDARVSGDEPLWLKNNTEAVIYLSKDRKYAADQVIKKEKPDLIILDDGYQHRRLNRDFNLVIIDASASWDSYHMLPWGRMREPFSSLKRAHTDVINKCNYADEYAIQRLRLKCLQYVGEDQIFLAFKIS